MTRIVLLASAIRWPHAPPEKPPKTSEWITPSRAQASIATGSSGTIGKWKVTRSCGFTPQKSFSRAASSFTRRWSSAYVISTVSCSSSSGTQMNAFSEPRVSRCRSTQLTHAFSFPPTHHLKNGGFDVSRIVSHFLSHVRRSAYSSKHSGKCSSPKRSRIAGSFAFATATIPGGGS